MTETSAPDITLDMALLQIELLTAEQKGASDGLGSYLDESINFYRSRVEALLANNENVAISQEGMEVR